MRSLIAIMLLCIFFVPCAAQEQDVPKNLIGFLKPGMHIGVVSYRDSDRITVTVHQCRG